MTKVSSLGLLLLASRAAMLAINNEVCMYLSQIVNKFNY